jgi:probable HAF family extracellular repeat protein
MTRMIAAVALLGLVAARPCAAATPAPTDLGVLGTNDFNQALGINGSGLIAGMCGFYDADYNAFFTATVWQPGDTTPTALPLLGGSYANSQIRLFGGCNPVKDSGLIAGECYYYFQAGMNPARQACVWQQVAGNWTVTGLGFLPGTAHDSSDTFAINAVGQVVGESYQTMGEDWAGFIWDSVNGMNPFPSNSLPVGSHTLMPVGGISDNGYVAGFAMAGLGNHNGGVIWDSASQTTIGYLPHGEPETISPSGLVAGFDFPSAPSGPSDLSIFLFVWNYNGGSPVETNLGHPDITPPVGLSMSDLIGMDIHATMINNNGQIVGYAYAYWNTGDPTTHTWMWDGSQFIDLATVLPADTPTFVATWPVLNAGGQVALNVVFADDSMAVYLWDGNLSNKAVALAGLGGSSTVYGFNAAGELAGTSFVPASAVFHACAWGLTAGQAAPQDLKQGVLAEMQALRATLRDRDDRKHLDDAIAALNRSLRPEYWVDPNHLAAKTGKLVFDQEKQAVSKLTECLNRKRPASTISKPLLQDWINRLVLADRTLAETAINEAIGAAGDPRKIADAQKHLANGDAKDAAGKHRDAIEQYCQAWLSARNA